MPAKDVGHPTRLGHSRSFEESVGAAADSSLFDAFSIKRTVGFGINYRRGRHRRKASLWGDGYGNFGAEHIRHVHVGFAKDWPTESSMLNDVDDALQDGVFNPDPHNTDRWITTWHSDGPILERMFGCGCGYTATVVSPLQLAPDGKPLGVITAWHNADAP